MTRYKPKSYFGVFKCDAAGNVEGGVVSACAHKHKTVRGAHLCRQRLEIGLDLVGQLTVRQVKLLDVPRKKQKRRRLR